MKNEENVVLKPVKMTENSQLLKQMFLPDGGTYALGSSFAATSGSGKTTLLSHLIKESLKLDSFKEVRFVYVSIKLEHLFGDEVKPLSTLNETFKSMAKNNLTVFYPTDPTNYETDVDNLIEGVFNMANVNDNGQYVIIVDDCNILQGFDNRGNPSPSMKKAAIAGRSKGVRLITICHRIGNMPRLFNGNISGLVLMNVSKMDIEYAKKVFGLEVDMMESLIDELTDYKWAYIDMIRGGVMRFNPVPHSK